MRGSLRLKLALGVFLVLLFGAVSFSHAQTSSSSITLRTAEEINQFLTEHYTEFTPEERDLIQKALQTRLANDGQGNFLFLPITKQLEVVDQVVLGFFSSLWPTYNRETKTMSYGVLGQLASWTDAFIAAPQPVTVSQMLASLSPAKTSFAQVNNGRGLRNMSIGHQTLGGFSGLITDYWLACRNFAYAILTIVLVVFGFMIMLRQNIEPRVVMTISNALPRIATTLVLITFSFAISGLIVDIGRVADGILVNNFASQDTDHSIFTLLASFADVGLTNMSATLKSTTYVWKFPEDTLDRNFPEWRCDYGPGCNGGSCRYRINYQDVDHPGTWRACPPFSCSLGPFGTGGKLFNCAVPLVPKAVKLRFWPGGPEVTFMPQICPELIAPDDVPPGACREKAAGLDDPELYPHGGGAAVGVPNCDRTYQGKSCCNYAMNECHDAQSIPWSFGFPRNFGNTLELAVNKIILIIVGALLNFLFFITLLQTIFSLLFKMISCFAMWFLYAIFSPFVFMWGAVPGQEDTVMDWAKNFLAAVLAFPAVNFVINLALAIAREYAGGAAPANYPSILFVGNPNTVALLVPFGMILMTPSIPDMLKDLIGAKGGKGAGAPDMSKQVKKLPIIGGLAG